MAARVPRRAARRAVAPVLSALLVGAPAWAQTAGTPSPPAAERAPEPASAESESLWAPPAPRGGGRLTGTLRPFFNLLGPGWGALNEFGAELYLTRFPLKLFAEAKPVALMADKGRLGMISHARVGAGVMTHLIGLDLGVGGRFQRLGQGGFSLAAAARLGAVDGLFLRFDLTYAIVRNYYTGDMVVAFSNIAMLLEVPVHPRAALFLEGGFSFDAWLFANLGLRHHLGPRGAPGTWTLRGGIGIAWVLDRFPCQYSDPRPCEGAVWATGPHLTLGLERRF